MPSEAGSNVIGSDRLSGVSTSDDGLPAPHSRRPRGWTRALVAMAAAAAAYALAGWIESGRGGPPRRIATMPGEHRTLDLPDGSRVILNGDTRIAFDPGKPRRMELLHGEAWFEPRGDDRRPFVVVAEKRRIVGGTAFNVVREGEALSVAVARGVVRIEHGRGTSALGPGFAFSQPGDAEPVIRRIAPAAVGSWRSGQLVYHDAPPGEVVRDLARGLGRPVRAVGAARNVRFTGTIMLDGSPDEILVRAGLLVGAQLEAGPVAAIRPR